jgi:hypothetical protein
MKSGKSKSENEGPSENEDFNSALDETLDITILGESLDLSKTVDQT